jgi:hypothetical protein
MAGHIKFDSGVPADGNLMVEGVPVNVRQGLFGLFLGVQGNDRVQIILVLEPGNGIRVQVIGIFLEQPFDL